MAAILLVDDDEAFGFAVSRRLKAAGHEVVTVRSSMKALDVLDAGSHVDIMLADIVLAKGEPNGISLARMARLKRPRIKTALITGYRDIAGDESTLPGPLFYKPLDLDEFADAVAGMLPRSPELPHRQGAA
jgi:DNA-binding NtrC family response regulator